MKTYTTMMLSILFAISSHGCGRTGGGASEVTTADPSAAQQQPNIRVAEAPTQGPTSSRSTGVVEDGVYKVCKVEKYPKMGGSDKKPTGPHLELMLNDPIEIRKGLPDDPVGRVIFRPEGKKEAALTVIKCCEGQRLGATMAFEHQKDKEKTKSVLHAIIIENVPKESRPKECPLKQVIVVRYCYPTYDDEGARGWSCGEDKNTHGGDVHAQL
jgi:hypothetical protein